MLKDAFPRFKTMQGFHVPRRAGWDCHGLPVEVAVEKELGLTSKRDIEAYGITAFNARCRESVLRHVDAFAEFTQRMGYWIDLSQAYRTMDAELHRVGVVVAEADLRQGPAGPGLPDQPLLPALRDPAVRPRDGPAGRLPDGGRPLGDRPVPAHDSASRRRPPQLAGADLLVWTTTPWTLVSNTAVAVHPDETYALARKSGVGDRVDRRRCAVRPRARRGLAHHRPVHRRGAGRGDLPAAVRPSSRCRTRTGSLPGPS